MINSVVILVTLGAALCAALPPCYMQTGTDPTPFYTSTAPVCSSAPPGVALPKGVTPTMIPATELLATITVSSKPITITYTAGRAPTLTTMVESNQFTTRTSTATAGALVWIPIPLPVVAGAPPPPPLPSVIFDEPNVEPEAPQSCTPTPVQGCLEECTVSYFPQSHTVASTVGCTDTCTTTTACNPEPETATTTVPYSAGSYETTSAQDVMAYRPPASDDEYDGFYGNTPTLDELYHNLLNWDDANGPIPLPQCINGNGTNAVKQAEAVRNAQAFCQANAWNLVDPDNYANNKQGNVDTYVQTTTRGQQAQIRVGYDMNNATRCPLADNHQITYYIDPARCQSILATIINGCDTETTQFKHGGQLQDGCAIYSFTPSSTDELTCNGSELTPYDPNGIIKSSSFPLSEARDAIGQYCSDASLYLDPKVKPPDPSTFQQGSTPGYPAMEYRYPPMTSDLIIQISATFYGDQTKCKPEQKFYIKPIEDECKRLLATAVNGCNTNTTTEKWGGTVLETQGPDGCVDWTIYASKGSS